MTSKKAPFTPQNFPIFCEPPQKILKHTIILIIAFWFLESLVDWLFFGNAPYTYALFPLDNSHELWMRISMITLLTMFIIYVHFSRQTTQQFLNREMVLGNVLDHSFNEIYLFDAATLKFIQVNSGACENLGYSENELLRMTPIDLKPDYDEHSFTALLSPLVENEVPQISFKTRHRRKDGSFYPVEIRMQISDLSETKVFLAIVQDISERESYILELERLALHDALTGLPNRTLLLDRMQQAIALAHRDKTSLMTIILDPRRMREINDIMGHNNGDHLLALVAKRLNNLFRSADTVARLEADEFVVVLSEPLEKFQIIMKRIKHCFQTPFIVGESVVHIDFAIGVAAYPQHGEDSAELLRNADIALNMAKMQKYNFKIFKAEDNPFTSRRLKLLGDLHTAIDNSEIELYYQPQIDLRTGKITGVEALARWTHPTEGPISPGEFIPIAENTGLIVPLTEYALQYAARQVRIWQELGIIIPISVNLSLMNLLDRNFPEQLQKLLKAEDVPPKLISLEITENVLMQNPQITLKILHELRTMGFDLHIDDYGTGYSSLNYLKQFPVNCLKIDQSFIRDILTDNRDMAIVHSTIDLAHNLGLKVIAEGVEDQVTLDQLKLLSCDMVQGYIYSRPIPALDFMEWMKQYQVTLEDNKFFRLNMANHSQHGSDESSQPWLKQ